MPEDSRMKVLHITTSLENAGAEGALFRLIQNSIDRTNHRVVCLSGRGSYADRLELLGISVTTLDMPRSRLTIKGLKQLTKILRDSVGCGTVVQTWMYHSDLIGGGIARMVGHNRIYWGIRNNSLDGSARATRLVVKTCALISRWIPTGIIACSVSAARYHAELGYRGSITVIPNGYDLEQLQVDLESGRQLRQELLLDDSFTIGFMARWDPVKDHDTLFRAVEIWAKTSPLKYNLVLVGKGCDSGNDQLKSLLQQYSLERNTKLLGQRSDVGDIMNMLDLHVLSSKSESFPNVIAEAMACGTPCLSTDVGDAAEIIGNTGWVVEPESPEAMAEGLQQASLALKDQGLPSKACRDRIAQKFSITSMIRAFHSVWENTGTGNST